MSQSWADCLIRDANAPFKSALNPLGYRSESMPNLLSNRWTCVRSFHCGGYVHEGNVLPLPNESGDTWPTGGVRLQFRGAETGLGVYQNGAMIQSTCFDETGKRVPRMVQYGRLDIEAKVPATPGVVCGLFLIGNGFEVDLEFVTRFGPDYAEMTIHPYITAHQPGGWTIARFIADLQAWNKWSIIWTPDKITYLINDKFFWDFAGNPAAGVSIPNKPMQFMANIWSVPKGSERAPWVLGDLPGYPTENVDFDLRNVVWTDLADMEQPAPTPSEFDDAWHEQVDIDMDRIAERVTVLEEHRLPSVEERLAALEARIESLDKWLKADSADIAVIKEERLPALEGRAGELSSSVALAHSRAAVLEGRIATAADALKGEEA